MASNIRGITVEIGGSTTKLDKALERVNTRSKNLQNELKKVDKLLKFDPSNTVLLSQKQDILRQSILNTKMKLSELQDVQKQIDAQYAKGEIDKGSYRAFQRELEATKQKLKELQKESDNFGNVIAQKISVAGGKVQELGGKIETVGKKFSAISTVASAGLAGATKVAIDFESAWAGVTKTVDGTEEEMESIKQGILDLSQSTASSAEDIAKVAENAGQLGVKTENILSFTETMVRLGDSTNISADEASSAIAKLYNIMGGDINTVDQFGSSIVALGNNMATTENDIMNMALRVAGSGKQIGLTEQEILALSASLSSVGMEAEAGGSAISAVMTQIDKDVALNTKNVKDWANVAGMSTKEFKTLWENDAMSAIQKVVQGMGDASAGGENLNVILEDLGVESLRQTDTMKRLSGASELLGESVKISNNAWSENTALTEESDKRYETTASKIQQLKNTVVELGVKLGEILLPKVQKIVEKLSTFVEWLTNLNPVAQSVILTIMGLVAGLAPVLIIVGKVTSAIGTIMTYAPQIMSVITKIKGLVTGLFSLIGAHPIIAIITAIIGIVILLYNKCDWFKEGVHKILNAVADFFKSAWETIKNVWNALPEFFSNLWNGLKTGVSNALTSVGDFFSSCWENIKNAWSAVTTFFSDLWNGIKTGVSNFIAEVVSRFTNIYGMIKSTFENVINVVKTVLVSGFAVAWLNIVAVWNTAKAYFTAIFDTIKLIFSAVKNVLTGNFSQAWENIKGIFATWGNFFNTVKENIKLIFSAVKGFFINVFSSMSTAVKNIMNTWRGFFANIWNNIKNVWSVVTTWFKNLFTNAWNGIKTAWSTVTTWFSNLLSAIINFFATLPSRLIAFFVNAWSGIKSAWSSVKSWFSNIVQAIFSFFQSIPSRLTNFFRNAWNNIKNVWSNVKSFFSNVISNITDTFKSLPSKMLEIGQNVIDGLVNGIRNKISAVTNAIKDVTSQITQKCKSILGIASPSRVMKALGEFTSEGLAIGIKNKGDLASDAMSNVSKSVIDSADTNALMKIGVSSNAHNNSGNTTNNNTQTKGNTIINFNGNYQFKDKNDIDYFMNQAGLKLIGVR